MTSIVDMIAAREAEAESIRADGAKQAREIVAKANETAKSAVDSAKEQARKKVSAKKAEAAAAAKRVRSDVLSKRKTESDAICENASFNIERAAEYVIERLSAS